MTNQFKLLNLSTQETVEGSKYLEPNHKHHYASVMCRHLQKGGLNYFILIYLIAKLILYFKCQFQM